MTTNRLARSEEVADRPIPPKGNSDEAKEARIRFWIARGNALLAEEGKYHLEWVWRNGNYSIEERQHNRIGSTFIDHSQPSAGAGR